MPWPGAGTHWRGGIIAVMRSPKPSRRRPAAASTSASYSPASSLRRRVSTLPRIGAKAAPAKADDSCAMRLTLLVPMLAGRPREASAARDVALRRRRQHEGVAGIFPRQRGRDRQPVRKHRGHVLGAVHRHVDGVVEQRVFDLLDEQPLGADFRDRRRLQPVAGCLDDDELDVHAGGFEPRRHRPRLPQRQLASARPDAKQRVHQSRRIGDTRALRGTSADGSSAPSPNRRFKASE